MIKIKAGYKTYSGNTMEIEIIGRLMPRSEVPLIEQADYKQLCEGCRGLNGGCAQWAPYFEYIKPSIKHFYVISTRLDMAWAIKYAHRHRNSIIHHNYFRMGYADLLTDRYTWGITKKLWQKTDLFTLGLGHCHGCRSKKACTVLQGDHCINPKARCYSIEATGVECSALNQILRNYRIPWWYKNEALPADMVRMSGLFTDDNLDNLLLDTVMKHRSYIPTSEVIQYPHYELADVPAPADSFDAGTMFLMYVDFDEGLVG